MNKIEEKLLNHLESGNKALAHSVVLAQLDADRFRTSMKVAHEKEAIFKIDELFEQDLEVDTVSLKDNWNTTYWTEMNVELSNNFSKEKLLHVIEVMTFLREKGDQKFMPKQDSRSVKPKKGKVSYSSEQRTETINNKGYIDKALIVGLSTVTGAVVGAGLVKGGIVTTPILKGAVIGGVAGAVVGITIAYVIHSKK